MLIYSLWLQEKRNPYRKAAHQRFHSDRVRIQTINQGWNRPLIVRVGEQNQLFVDEVIVGEVPGLTSIQVLLEIKNERNCNNTYMNQHFNMSSEWCLFVSGQEWGVWKFYKLFKVFINKYICWSFCLRHLECKHISEDNQTAHNQNLSKEFTQRKKHTHQIKPWCFRF